jgi:hypothetical protein
MERHLLQEGLAALARGEEAILPAMVACRAFLLRESAEMFRGLDLLLAVPT